MADKNKLILGTNADTYIAADDAGNIILQNERGVRVQVDNEGIKASVAGGAMEAIGAGGATVGYLYEEELSLGSYDDDGSPYEIPMPPGLLDFIYENGTTRVLFEFIIYTAAWQEGNIYDAYYATESLLTPNPSWAPGAVFNHPYSTALDTAPRDNRIIHLVWGPVDYSYLDRGIYMPTNTRLADVTIGWSPMPMTIKVKVKSLDIY